MQVNYLLLTLKTEKMTDDFRFCVCTLRGASTSSNYCWI